MQKCGSMHCHDPGHVRNLQVNSGAGFLVVLTGAIMRMPGLPRQPLAQAVKYHSDGTIEGIG